MAHLLTQRSWNETRTGVVGGVYGRRSTPEVSNPEQKDQEGRLCSSGSCSRLGSHSGTVANGAGGTQCGWRDAVAGYGETKLHRRDRKSTRLNSSHGYISYAVFCLKKKIIQFIYYDDVTNQCR